MTRPRALVVGGSVGGLFAGHLLRAAGWEVEVFERAREDLGGRGAGVGTLPELFAVLQRIGIALDGSIGVPVRSRKFLTCDGRLAHEIERRSVNSAWDCIYRPLKQAFPPGHFHAGCTFESAEERGGRVIARFADGTRAEGDLLIGADGIHSAVRKHCPGDGEPRYSGYFGWRGYLDETELPAPVHAELFHHLSFCTPPDELVVSMPLPGRGETTQVGRRRYGFIWFHRADLQQLALLCTDASGRCHGTSIAPPLIRREVIEAMHAAARERLPPQLAAVVTRVSQPILQPIFDLASPRMVFGRFVLLGDAAFVVRPHVATGITKAALDAQCLADVLRAATDLGTALAAYEAARLPVGLAMVERSRALGSYLEPGPKSLEQHRIADEHRRPEIIIQEYGAAGRMVVPPG